MSSNIKIKKTASTAAKNLLLEPRLSNIVGITVLKKLIKQKCSYYATRSVFPINIHY